MSFHAHWLPGAKQTFDNLEQAALAARTRRLANGMTKSSRQEGLFKQVLKAVELLKQNPRHQSLNTHEYDSMPNPIRPGEKVWEAYAQNNTPGAYRIFFVYGPGQKEITIIAITPHP